MRTIIALILGASCMVVLHALCPQPNTLKDAAGNKICARLFDDSHYVYDQSCGGEYLDIPINTDAPIMPHSWRNRASSLVASSRCHLTVWSQNKKEGFKRRFTGIQYRLKDVIQGLMSNWDNDIAAYHCTC